MAINFRLTIATEMLLEQAAKLAAPEATEKPPAPGHSPYFSADFYEQRGYAITISGGKNGYYSAEGDSGDEFEWELETYINFSFHMRKSMGDEDVSNMLTTVARILASRPEDAALIQDGNWLLLTRLNGKLRKHSLSDFWRGAVYNNIIPG
ncbi:SitI3 family protein [Micromonospora sp. NPDC003197]